ncbi:MAG TPA: hypothetical protein VHO24_07835 [Opitutaceae bacterium]|nr:hypothetical protein [Opitutaceae bacterium]
MKPLPLFLVLAAALSCRAETPAANSAKPSETAKPAQSAPVQSEDVADQAPTVIAAVVSKPVSLKPFGLDIKKSLSNSLADQQAAMTQNLADQAQSQKLVAGYLTVEQPALPSVTATSALVTARPDGTATVVIAGKTTEFKTEADAKAFVAQQQRNQPSAALGAPTSELKNMGAAAFRLK